MKSKKTIKNKITKNLEIPSSSFIGGSKITLNSNDEAIVEGCKNIIEYFEDNIKLNLGNKTVTFLGSNLSINALTINGVVISGKITSLEF